MPYLLAVYLGCYAEGEKMGLLRWELKVVTREEQPVVEEEKVIVKPLVREDLIGLVKIY